MLIDYVPITLGIFALAFLVLSSQTSKQHMALEQLFLFLMLFMFYSAMAIIHQTYDTSLTNALYMTSLGVFAFMLFYTFVNVLVYFIGMWSVKKNSRVK
jgi:hypothetical protein